MKPKELEKKKLQTGNFAHTPMTQLQFENINIRVLPLEEATDRTLTGRRRRDRSPEKCPTAQCPEQSVSDLE
jgi:hypothetical protein